MSNSQDQEGLEALAKLASSSSSSDQRSMSSGNRVGESSAAESAAARDARANSMENEAAARASQSTTTPSLSSLQQLQQLLALTGGSQQSQHVNLANLLGNAGQSPQPTHQQQPDANALLALQQLAQHQAQQALLQRLGGGGGQSQTGQAGLLETAKAAQLLFGSPNQGQNVHHAIDTDALVNQVLPAAQVNAQGNSGTKMPPPSGPPIVTAMAAAPVSIAPQPAAAFEQSGSYDNLTDDKRLQKREANRRSAQLSRKRKKQFTEELKEENDELRKKELILRSIPDLVLVFDSTGKLWFVSESVSRFLNFTAKELEGQSVWDRLCEDSTRLLKAAFMDALAARSPDSDTAPLGSGLWELRIVDKDNSQKVVTLNGVVHFSGDRPECVCSIRPSQQANKKDPNKKSSTEETLDKHYTSLICVHPQQSVVGNGGSGSSHRKGKRGREAMRISDSGNSSGESETASGSGSSDD